MEQWRIDNRRDKRPAHNYTLEDFGLNPSKITEEFGDYRREFIEPRL
jgi:hypothetical protein